MKILFEDKNYLIVEKPAGMLVHTDGLSKADTIVNWLKEKYPELEEVGGMIDIQHGDPIKRWGLVHRIDRETSGIIVITKNQPAFEDLQKKFQTRKISKTYYAFVYGRVPIDQQIISEPVGRSRADFRRYATGAEARGNLREAVTEYKVLHKTDEVTFVEVSPKTGRTHQIRVHMRSIGHPVVCDSLYASLKKPILGFQRLALHARHISFKGIDGNEISATSDFPEDFTNAMKTMGVEEIVAK